MQRKEDTSGIHVLLVLSKAFRALAAHAGNSLNLSRAGLGDSDFRVLEVLLHKGPLPVKRQVDQAGSPESAPVRRRRRHARRLRRPASIRDSRQATGPSPVRILITGASPSAT